MRVGTPILRSIDEDGDKAAVSERSIHKLKATTVVVDNITGDLNA